jgi:hypothetical protein
MKTTVKMPRWKRYFNIVFGVPSVPRSDKQSEDPGSTYNATAEIQRAEHILLHDNSIYYSGRSEEDIIQMC